MRRVAVHTLGCKLNFAESSAIGRQFIDRGFKVVGIDESADVCVINTCSVTERADRECRQIVRRALRHSPNAYVVVTGCYAQLRPEQIAAIPGVDLVLGTKDKFDIFQHTDDFIKSECSQTFVSPISAAEAFAPASSVGSADRTRAFLKVQDGCDYSCAFCTIPLARGSSRSTAIPAIIAQARAAVASGYQEVVLTGVNVGDYGSKIGSSLVALLESLTEVDGLSRIRISSIEPNLLTDELLSLWASNFKICKHFHLPLQGGNDDILKKMRRRYLTESYAERVRKIKTLLPQAGIGGDVITGFPGETDDLFKQTYKFIVDLPLSYLHVFTYSERPDTIAISMPGKTEPRIRFERSELLRSLSLRKRMAFNSGFIGSTREVLFEGRNNNGDWTGLTSEYVRVNMASNLDLSNRLVMTKIINIEGDDCIGQLVTSFNNNSPHSTTMNEVPLCA